VVKMAKLRRDIILEMKIETVTDKVAIRGSI
jgi:hypothetical protein